MHPQLTRALLGQELEQLLHIGCLCVGRWGSRPSTPSLGLQRELWLCLGFPRAQQGLGGLEEQFSPGGALTRLGPVGLPQESHGSGVSAQHGAEEPAEEDEDAGRGLRLPELDGGKQSSVRAPSPHGGDEGTSPPRDLEVAARGGPVLAVTVALTVTEAHPGLCLAPAEGLRGRVADQVLALRLRGQPSLPGAILQQPRVSCRDPRPLSPSQEGLRGGTHLLWLQQPAQDELFHDVLAPVVQGLAGLGQEEEEEERGWLVPGVPPATQRPP